jgi:hypothetical protein
MEVCLIKYILNPCSLLHFALKVVSFFVKLLYERSKYADCSLDVAIFIKQIVILALGCQTSHFVNIVQFALEAQYKL